MLLLLLSDARAQDSIPYGFIATFGMYVSVLCSIKLAVRELAVIVGIDLVYRSSLHFTS